jgi:5'-nucleotidase
VQKALNLVREFFMKILLCNDDGIHAEGIWALQKRLVARHTVVVVAPDRERTAASHAITLHAPIRINKISINGRGSAYAVSGTPADCIKLAVTEILDGKPDLVISGINPGANIGVDINYSGTLAAAREATFYGIPALAVSIAGKTPAYYKDIADFIGNFSEMILEKGLPKGTLLNINAPDLPMKQLRGVRFCKQYTGLMSGDIEKRMDPRNRAYYWYGNNAPIADDDPELDAVVLFNDYISITPITCDMTDYSLLQTLKGWDIPIE